jgi:hypothetical protein
MLRRTEELTMRVFGLCLLLCAALRAGELPTGDAVIRAPAGDSEIVITTTRRTAGAIHSLTWNGVEFLDSFDHGRQMQSASNFDVGSPFTPETFNPTEAGSRSDGAGERSTSRLLHLLVRGHELQTTSQMAFWLKPGERSEAHLAKNTTALSDHLLTKRVRIGWRDLPHVIDYAVTFSVPIGERHTFAQFEAVTGYMPERFSKFWSFDEATGKLDALTDGPGEQSRPVVLATEDGRYAMGVWSPQQPSAGFESAGYGRFRFPAAKVVKWNCVFRMRNPACVPAGDYTFCSFVMVGDLERVRENLVTMTKLRAELLRELSR